ncbi:MAG: TspO/MBR family protein [Rhizomicrobium sp.]
MKRLGDWRLAAEDDFESKRAARRPLLAFLLATLAVGAAASVFTEPSLAGWYQGVNKPAFAPPAWLLPPLWTGLYALMALAAWRVWKIAGLKSTAMALYSLQLAFTFVWTALFFGPHRTALALSALVFLVVLGLATDIVFWRHDRLAGLLYLPCVAAVGFAAVLVRLFQALNG